MPSIYVRFRGEPDIAAQREVSGQKLGRATWGRGAELPDRQAHWSTPRAPAARRREAQSWPLRPPASKREATRVRRDFAPPPARSSSHLREKLLEQSAQLERWAIAAVAHDGRRDVCAPPARELSVASASRWR